MKIKHLSSVSFPWVNISLQRLSRLSSAFVQSVWRHCLHHAILTVLICSGHGYHLRMGQPCSIQAVAMTPCLIAQRCSCVLLWHAFSQYHDSAAQPDGLRLTAGGFLVLAEWRDGQCCLPRHVPQVPGGYPWEPLHWLASSPPCAWHCWCARLFQCHAGLSPFMLIAVIWCYSQVCLCVFAK